MVDGRWTHVTKLWGMQHCPWLSEPVLDHALYYKMGQVPGGDSGAEELARFLDEHGVDDDVWKDKQFRANVSLSSF